MAEVEEGVADRAAVFAGDEDPHVEGPAVTILTTVMLSSRPTPAATHRRGSTLRHIR
jgi:hypothetical protein